MESDTKGVGLSNGGEPYSVLVYVAGPFSAEHGWGRQCNVHAAASVGAGLGLLGFAAFIPHKNTEDYHELFSFDEIIAWDLSILRRCDAMVLLPGWKDSKGSCMEYAECIFEGIPCYEWPDLGTPLGPDEIERPE